MFVGRRLLACAFGFAATLHGALPAPAADATGDEGSAGRGEVAPTRLGEGDWLLRARAAGLFPVDETSTVGRIGGRIETPAMLLPDLQIAYFLTESLSIEGQAGVVRTRPRIVDSMVGDIEIGSIWSIAAAASLQYHFRPGSAFRPYVGVGVSYSHPISIEPSDGIADFDVSSQTSVLIQAGADHHIAGNWFASAVARYLFVPEQVYEGGGARFTSDADMVFAGAGIAYRF